VNNVCFFLMMRQCPLKIVVHSLVSPFKYLDVQYKSPLRPTLNA
jgi:hypothetical protein